MEKLYTIIVPICIKIKKMYTNNEIEIIVDNCNTMQELYAVTKSFAYLIEHKYQKKSGYLMVKTQLRFRELTRL